MTEAVTARELFEQLCKLIDLPKTTRAVTLRCAIDEVPTLDVEYFVQESDLLGTNIVARFELTPIEGDQCSTG